MPDEAVVQAFINRIVSDALPEDKDAFDAVANDVIADLWNGRKLRRTVGGEFGFHTPDGVIDAIKLAVATVPLIKAFWPSTGKAAAPVPSLPELKARWKADLVTAGMDAAMAELISAKFAGDLQGLAGKA